MKLKRQKLRDKFGEIELYNPSPQEEAKLLEVIKKELLDNPDQKHLELGYETMKKEILPILTNIPIEVIDEEAWDLPTQEFEDTIIEIYIILTRIYSNHLKKEQLKLIKGTAELDGALTIKQAIENLPKDAKEQLQKATQGSIVKNEKKEMIEKLKEAGYNDIQIKKLTGEG